MTDIILRTLCSMSRVCYRGLLPMVLVIAVMPGVYYTMLKPALAPSPAGAPSEPRQSASTPLPSVSRISTTRTEEVVTSAAVVNPEASQTASALHRDARVSTPSTEAPKKPAAELSRSRRTDQDKITATVSPRKAAVPTCPPDWIALDNECYSPAFPAQDFVSSEDCRVELGQCTPMYEYCSEYQAKVVSKQQLKSWTRCVCVHVIFTRL